MCNLYSLTKGQAAIVALVRAMRDRTGNLPPLPGIFPDYNAPVVRNAPDGVRELAMCRWGVPSSQFALMQAAKKRALKLELKGKPVDFKELLRMEPDGGTTNIRNTDSKLWTRWLGPYNDERRATFHQREEPDATKRRAPPWGLEARTLLPSYAIRTRRSILWFQEIDAALQRATIGRRCHVR